MAPHLDFKHLGLSDEEVLNSRRQHGDNMLTPPERPSWIKLYLESFKDPIIRILIVAACMSLAIGIIENEYIETIGIIIAILLATSIGFYFELDASRKFDILNALGQEEMCTVVRNNEIVQIPRSQIVAGDIVVMQQGEEVPADGELLKAVQLLVNESSLTGEPSANKYILAETP
jgi:Ca2+-transporting ATPase